MMAKHYDYLIVGSGLFGATFAHLAHKQGNANSTSKCKITKCFCKSTPLVLRNSISFLVSH